MSIQSELDKIKSAIKGQDVRGAIHDGIKKAYDDASVKDNANMEVKMARGNNSTLSKRLEAVDSNTRQVEQLARANQDIKVDKNGAGQVKWANLAQDAKEQISGDKVAVVGKDSVSTENVVNKSITSTKRTYHGEWLAVIHSAGTMPIFDMSSKTLTFPSPTLFQYRNASWTSEEKIVVDYSGVGSAYIKVTFHVPSKTFTASTVGTPIEDRENTFMVATFSKDWSGLSCLFDYEIKGRTGVELKALNNGDVSTVAPSSNGNWELLPAYNGAYYIRATTYVEVWARMVTRETVAGYNHQWSSIVNQVPNQHINTIDGKDYIHLKHGFCFVYNRDENEFDVVHYASYFPQKHILLARNWYGFIDSGIILKPITQRNHVKLLDIEKQVNALAEGKELIPEFVYEGAKEINIDIANNYTDSFKFAYVTDTHGQNIDFDYLKELAKYGQAEAVVLNGDLNRYDYETKKEDTQEHFARIARQLYGIENMFITRGNHDGVPDRSYTDEMFTSALIKPFVKENVEDKGYYYKDFPSHRLRLIFLNSAMDSLSRNGFDSAQVGWFEDTLATTEEGWSVVTFSHHHLLKKYDTATKPHNSNAVVQAIKDFKNNNPNNNHIAHMFGHVHYDLIEVVEGVTHVATDCDVIENGAPSVNVNGIVKNNKTRGTASSYLMDMIAINQETKTVTLKRFGAGSDREFTY